MWPRTGPRVGNDWPRASTGWRTTLQASEWQREKLLSKGRFTELDYETDEDIRLVADELVASYEGPHEYLRSLRQRVLAKKPLTPFQARGALNLARAALFASRVEDRTEEELEAQVVLSRADSGT